MGLCPILIGREKELGSLEAALDRPGGVVTITGGPGVGKSRLLREIATLARERQRSVIWGRPEAIAASGPFSMILDLIEGVARRSGQVATEARALLDEIFNLEDGTPPGGNFVRRMAARVRGLLGQLDGAPVIILEDLHAVDEASVLVAFQLARSAHDDSYLLACSYRPESVRPEGELAKALAILEKERTIVELALHPLDDVDSERLVQATTNRDLSDEEISTILRLGEGVPFFLEELASIAALGGALPTVPDSIGRSITLQLRDMTPATALLVKTASLVESALDREVLREISSQGDSDQALSEAKESGLLVEDGDLLVFRHTLVRRAIASSMSSAEQQQLHRQLAGILARLYPGDERAWQVASHWAAAKEYSLAAHSAIRAGNRALGLAATADARVAFDAALSWSNSEDMRIAALEGLTLVAFREGRDEDAARLAKEVVETYRASGRYAEAAAGLGRLALVLTRTDDPDGVAAALDQGLAIARRDSAAEVWARLTAQKANYLIFYRGEFQEAETLMQQAVRQSEKIGAKAIMAVANDGLAEIASWKGNFALADRLGEMSLDQAKVSKDVEAVGRTHNNHAVRLVIHGRPQLGLSILDQGQEVMVASFGTAGVSSLHVTRAWIRHMTGQPALTLQALSDVASIWMAWRGLAAGLRVWALVEVGDSDEAEVVLEHAWQEAGYSGGWQALRDNFEQATPDVLELLPAEVAFRCAMHQYPSAAGAALLHQRLSGASGQPAEWARSAALVARAFTLGGDTRSAESASKTLWNLLKERPYPYFRACAFEIDGLRLSSLGDVQGAARFFAMGAEEFAKCSNMSDQARCLRYAVQGAVQDGNRAHEAKEHLSRARELALRAGASRELAQCEQQLRAIGIRPRAGRPKRDHPKRPLSAREEQIAALVAAGASNQEIARRLFIAEATVAGYVSTALRKLSLSGRAALAAWSAKEGLI